MTIILYLFQTFFDDLKNKAFLPDKYEYPFAKLLIKLQEVAFKASS